MTRLKEQTHVNAWLATPLDRSVETSLVRLSRAPDVVRMAVMPDVHLGQDVCIGAVVATTQLIYPAAVGGDIGCGMLALRFHAEAACLQSEAAAHRLLAGLHRRIPSLKHLPGECPERLPADLLDTPLSHPALEKLKVREGRWQLGTLGRGNHFVEFQGDEEDRLWILIHSGSRGVGQAVTAHHLRLAGSEQCGGKLVSLDSLSDAGQAYLQDVTWARRYAEWNRFNMLNAAIQLLQRFLAIEPDRESLIQSDHNHVQQEMLNGERLWIHRKGAQSAREGEPGIVPGSMGAETFHTEGRGLADALCSSSHGAGRVLSRTEATQRISVQQLKRETSGVWLDPGRLNDLRDEAPSTYRNVRQVMQAQRHLCKIVRSLRPVLNDKR